MASLYRGRHGRARRRLRGLAADFACEREYVDVCAGDVELFGAELPEGTCFDFLGGDE